jgi:hypothetical protein
VTKMTHQPTQVVIDIDDTLDVVEIPPELSRRAAEMVPEGDLPRVLQLIGLLIARLGRDSAVPVIQSWMAHTPTVLTDFPEALREELVTGSIAPLRTTLTAVFPVAGVTSNDSSSAVTPGQSRPAT